MTYRHVKLPDSVAIRHISLLLYLPSTPPDRLLTGCFVDREGSCSPREHGQLSGTVERKTPKPSGRETGGQGYYSLVLIQLTSNTLDPTSLHDKLGVNPQDGLYEADGVPCDKSTLFCKINF